MSEEKETTADGTTEAADTTTTEPPATVSKGVTQLGDLVRSIHVGDGRSLVLRSDTARRPPVARVYLQHRDGTAHFVARMRDGDIKALVKGLHQCRDAMGTSVHPLAPTAARLDANHGETEAGRQLPDSGTSMRRDEGLPVGGQIVAETKFSARILDAAPMEDEP